MSPRHGSITRTGSETFVEYTISDDNDFSDLDFEALQELVHLVQASELAVRAEIARRATIDAIPVQIAQLSGQYLDAIGREPGKPWVQPAGAHDAYPQGWTVTHNGRQWESLTPANVWEPGISGWREATAEGGGPAEWVQPTGAHDAYKTGDLVTHLGKVWRSTRNDNVWAPGITGWEKV